MAETDMISSVPPEFDEAGIKPLTYGQPELAKATSYKALARQIERDGVKDEAGRALASYDAEGAEALARTFVYPRTSASAAVASPMYKHMQAGTVALMAAPVFATRTNPSLLNPRVGPLVAIPKADAQGRVALSWAPADVDVDPGANERLRQEIPSLDELVTSSRETAEKVLALQQELAESIGREGVEEPLLIVMTRLEVGAAAGSVRDIVPIAADGGSRLTIAQEYLAEAVAALLTDKEREYATKHKRRAALEALEHALRVHQPATLIDDPVAERELRDYLVELAHRPAAELVKSRMYAAQRSLVVPALVVVGFRPNGSATILDAIDQLVGNQHKRGPLQWQPAARALDSRNSVVRSLWRKGTIGEGKAMLLGPRFEEASKKFGIHKDPDFRIGEVVRIFHGDEARRPLREAFGTAASRTTDRAEVIAAVIGEQLRTADPAFRKQVETTLRDTLGHPPFYGAGVPSFGSTNPDPDALVADVKQAESQAPNTLSSAHAELGVKGGVALVLLGALAREHGANAADAPRPYAVLQRMLHDEFGQDLLGEAIKALRAGHRAIPARDPDTKQEKGRDSHNRVVAMTPTNLRELFPSTTGGSGGNGSGGGGARTQDDVLAEMKSVARNNLGVLLDELRKIPEVTRTGISPYRAKELVDLLFDQAQEIDYLGRKGEEHLLVSEEEVATADEAAA